MNIKHLLWNGNIFFFCSYAILIFIFANFLFRFFQGFEEVTSIFYSKCCKYAFIWRFAGMKFDVVIFLEIFKFETGKKNDYYWMEYYSREEWWMLQAYEGRKPHFHDTIWILLLHIIIHDNNNNFNVTYGTENGNGIRFTAE